jgi:hypothetical protein
MMDWIKKNSTAVVWMLAGTLLGLALPNFQGTPNTLDHIGGGVVGLLFSAYLALYLYNGPTGAAALKRLVPALVLGAIAGVLWWTGFVFPAFLLPGLYAACVSLWIAALIGPLVKPRA